MADRYWVNPNATGGAWNSTASWSATDGGPSGASIPTAADDVYINNTIAPSNAEVNINTTTAVCRNLSISGNIFIRGAIGLTISGSATMSSGVDFTSGGVINYTGTITFNGTLTGANSHKISIPPTLPCPVTIAGTGEFVLMNNIVQGSGAGTATPAFTFTQGTLRLNGYGINTFQFSSSNSNTRVLDFGCPSTSNNGSAPTILGSISLKDPDADANTVATPLNCATVTGLTVLSTVSGDVQSTDQWSAKQIYAYLGTGSGTVAKSATYTWGTTGGTAANAVDLDISGSNTAATFTATIGTGSRFRSLDVYYFYGVMASTTVNVFAGADLRSFGTFGTAFILNGIASSDNNGDWWQIWEGGKDVAINVNATGTYVKSGVTYNNGYYVDSSAPTKTLTLTSGHIQLQSTTIHSFSSSNSNVRSINLQGSVSLSGTGVIWETSTVTNLVSDFWKSNITLTNTTNTSRTFNGGATTYRKLVISGDSQTTTAGGITVLGAGSTFYTITNDRKYTTHFLTLTGTTTVHYLADLGGGDATTRLTIRSSDTTTPTLRSLLKGGPRFVDITDIDNVTFQAIAAGPMTWYVGANCTTATSSTGFVIGTTAYRYWVGGTANWDGTAGTKWATTSGGTGGASAPAAGNAVVFDSNSGAGTVTVGNATMFSLNTSGFAGSIVSTSAFTLTAADLVSTTALDGYNGNYVINPVDFNAAVLTPGADPTIRSSSFQHSSQLIPITGTVTFSGSNSTTTLATTTRYVKNTVTLTSGTVQVPAFSQLYARSISSSGTNNRAFIGDIHVGLSQPEIDSTTVVGGTIWNAATATGFNIEVVNNPTTTSAFYNQPTVTNIKGCTVYLYTNGNATTVVNHGTTAMTSAISSIDRTIVQAVSSAGSIALNGAFNGLEIDNYGGSAALTVTGTRTIRRWQKVWANASNNGATVSLTGAITISPGIVAAWQNAYSVSYQGATDYNYIYLTQTRGAGAFTDIVDSCTYTQNLTGASVGTTNGSYWADPFTVKLETGTFSGWAVKGAYTLTYGDIFVPGPIASHFAGGLTHTQGKIEWSTWTSEAMFMKTYTSSGTTQRCLKGGRLYVGFNDSTTTSMTGAGGTIWSIADATNWGVYSAATGATYGLNPITVYQPDEIWFQTDGVATTVVNHGTTTIPNKLNSLYKASVRPNSSATAASIALNGHFADLDVSNWSAYSAVGNLTVTGTKTVYYNWYLDADVPLTVSGTTTIGTGIESAIGKSIATATDTFNTYDIKFTNLGYAERILLWQNGGAVTDNIAYTINTTGRDVNFGDRYLVTPMTAFTSTGALTLTAGTLDIAYNSYSVTVPSISSSGTGTRSIKMSWEISAGYINGGTLYLTGTGTVWDTTTATNFSISYANYGPEYGNAPLGEIVLSNNTTTARTFAGGGYTGYGILRISGTTSNSTTNITGSNTFYEIKNDKTVANTVTFVAGATNTFSRWSMKGTAGNVVTVQSATAAATTLALASGRKTNRGTNYLTFSWINGSANNQWYIGLNSTKSNSNTNIITGVDTNYKKYWVGGAGTWDNTATNRWSLTSGGATGALVPDSQDEVIFDQNSDLGNTGNPYQVTIPTGTIVNVYGITATTLDAQLQLQLADSTSEIRCYGSINMSSSNVTIATSSVVNNNYGVVSLYNSEFTTTPVNLAINPSSANTYSLQIRTAYGVLLTSSLKTDGVLIHDFGAIDLNNSSNLLEVGSYYATGSTGTWSQYTSLPFPYITLYGNPVKLTGKNRTILTCGNTADITISSTPSITDNLFFLAEYTGTATGTRVISQRAQGGYTSSISTDQYINVKIKGSDTVQFANGSYHRAIDLSEFTGSVDAGGTLYIRHNGTLRISPSLTFTGGTVRLENYSNLSDTSSCSVFTNGGSFGVANLYIAGLTANFDAYDIQCNNLTLTVSNVYSSFYYFGKLTHTKKIIASGTITSLGGILTLNGTYTGSAIRCSEFLMSSSVFNSISGRNFYNKLEITGTINSGYAIECTSSTGNLQLGGALSQYAAQNILPLTGNVVNLPVTINSSGALLAGDAFDIQNIPSTYVLPTISGAYSQYNWLNSTQSSRTFTSVNTPITIEKQISVGYISINASGTTRNVSLAGVNANGTTHGINAIKASASFTSSAALSFGASAILSTSSGSANMNITGGVTTSGVGSNLTITSAFSSSTVTITNNITSSANLTLEGYSISVSGGTAAVTAAGTLEFSGSSSLSCASITVGNFSSLTNSAVFAVSGNITTTNASASTIKFTGSSTISGNISSASGALTLDFSTSNSGATVQNVTAGSSLSLTGSSSAQLVVNGDLTSTGAFSLTTMTLTCYGVQTYNNNYTHNSGSNRFYKNSSIASVLFWSNGSIELNGDLGFGEPPAVALTVGGNLELGNSTIQRYMTMADGSTITVTGNTIRADGGWVFSGVSGQNKITWSNSSAKSYGPRSAFNTSYSQYPYLVATFPEIYVSQTTGNLTLNSGSYIGTLKFNSSYTGAISFAGSVVFGGDLTIPFQSTVTGSASTVTFMNWNAIFNDVDQVITTNGVSFSGISSTVFSAATPTANAKGYYTKFIGSYTTNGSIAFGGTGVAVDFNGYTLTGTTATFINPTSGYFRKIKGAVGSSLVLTSNSGSLTIPAASSTAQDKLEMENIIIDMNTPSASSISYINLAVSENGSSLFGGAGEYSFIVPDGVTQLSGVAIGGGGGGGAEDSVGSGYGGTTRYSAPGGGGGALHYRTFSVTPGEILTIGVGAAGLGGTTDGAGGDSGGESYIKRGATYLVRATGGIGPASAGSSGGSGGTSYHPSLGGGGGNGGAGGNARSGGGAGGGGGGAGGYSGNGGAGATSVNGGTASGSSGTGGAGGGSGTRSGSGGTSGGGVAVFGTGNSGTGGISSASGGDGSNNQGSTTVYGSGGSGAYGTDGVLGSDGGAGAVRLVWNTTISRAYPSTNVNTASQELIPTKTSFVLRGNNTSSFSTSLTLTAPTQGMRFNVLGNYHSTPITLFLPSVNIQVDDWQFNGKAYKAKQQTGYHVLVDGNGSGNTTLTKTGSGSNVFKYVALTDLTLSGNWIGRDASAANIDTVTYASPTRIGWFKALTSGTSYIPPSHWNNSNNVVHLIGAGGGGGGSLYTSTASVRAGAGGGAGGYSQIVNFQVTTPGTTSITYAIGTAGTAGATNGGAGGAGGNTTWNAGQYTATGGAGGSGTTGGTGGTGTGYNGGKGGDARAAASYTVAYRGGGGGGAGGPFGVGVAGQSPATTGTTTTSYGGSHGGGFSASDGSVQNNFMNYSRDGSSATPGKDFFNFNGSGAGGNSTTTTGGSGQSYGGGGAGGSKPANNSTTYTGGAGAAGAILLTWNIPVDIINTQFFLTI